MRAADRAGTRLPEDALALMRGKGASKLFCALDEGGEETRFVGGAVRNALLGLPVSEIDLATTALPDQVMTRAAAAGLKAVPTGIEHGTVTVVVDGAPFEVTTLRADVETDGRHAKVRFGRSFAEDALRRDFTINALSASPDGKVFDYAGGLADLAERRVRFIGDPARRIEEDYLRILRFFRFHALFGAGPLDRAGFDAVVRLRRGLARLSRERIAAELMKLLAAPGAGAACDAMSGAGLFELILGGIAVPARLERAIAIEAVHSSPADALLRLAALAVLITEDAERLRDRLRLPNDAGKRLAEAAALRARLHGRAMPPDEGELTELLFLHGRQAACDALVLAQADGTAPADDPGWSAAAQFAAEAPCPRLPVTGADILARGFASGPRVGEVLKALQARWIRAGFPRQPAVLAGLIDEAVDQVRARAEDQG